MSIERPSEVNNHHAFWIRKAWLGKCATRILREQPLFIWPISIDAHNDLHANIGPIDPICSELAYNSIQWIRDHKNEPVDEFIDHMRKVSRTSSRRRSVQAGIVADHLEIQQDFLRGRA